MRKILPLVICLVPFLSVLSCVYHDISAVSCDEFRIVSYNDDIKPIITASCARNDVGDCHDGANGADINWTMLTNLQDHKENLKDRITRASGADGHMPKVGSITIDQIQLIYCWADQGAKDN